MDEPGLVASPISSKFRALPSGTIEWMMPSLNRKMRGLREPMAGCALNKLRVATKRSGRSSAWRKHAKLSGLGKPFTKATVSAMDGGLPVVPGAGAQRSSSPAPPEPSAPSTGSLATGAASPLLQAMARPQQAKLKLTRAGRGQPARDGVFTR
jgi:hypothetical protein